LGSGTDVALGFGFEFGFGFGFNIGNPKTRFVLGSTSEPGGNSIYERTKYFKPKHT
jgi:hypothetical protein